MNFEIAPKETEVVTNWNAAKLYCFALTVNNKTGWRLPTVTELAEIAKIENDFEHGRYYWSSTENRYSPNEARTMIVAPHASGGTCEKHWSDIDIVRAVRDIV